MKQTLNSLAAVLLISTCTACGKEDPQLQPQAPTNMVAPQNNPDYRVPAEWETHAATWMQWPGSYETSLRSAFADIIDVVQDYEPVHLLTSTEGEKEAAQRYLANRGVPNKNITWHLIGVDNAWMRDNGPIYVSDGKDLTIQNWGFKGWDGSVGAYYDQDNAVPARVGTLVNMEVEDRTGYVLEKGNLEVNGQGIALLNWDCQKQRNPGMSMADHEALLKGALGLKKIIWAHGYDPQDLTTGHIDGTARFVDANTVVVADYYLPSTENALAATLQTEGFNVVRYAGSPNWLVGNGFVAAMGDGSANDANLKAQLEQVFPGKDVYMIDGRAIENSGGGIHCLTNDQPLMP